MLAANALEHNPDIGDEELLDVLSSNLCRCTGYQNIIKAVRAARDEMRAARVRDDDGSHSCYRPSCPALVARIHVFLSRRDEKRGWPGTSPAMTSGRRSQVSLTMNQHARPPTATIRSRRRRASGGCSGMRCRASRICRWSPAAGATPATSTFRISCICAWCAPPKAHGRIISVDASAALALPGVFAVWTNADIADLSPIDFRADKNATGIREFRQPALAKTYVRYIGDPVAAVFAEDPYVAEDAAELVTVEIEELPAVISASDPPGEFEPGRSTEAIMLHHSYGDIDAAFRNAACGDRDRSSDRPALRRAAGDPRRHRPLRRGEGSPGAARRRQDPAPQSRDALPHAQAQPVVAACA